MDIVNSALNFRLIVDFFVHRVAYEQDPGKRRKRGSIFFRKKKVRKHLIWNEISFLALKCKNCCSFRRVHCVALLQYFKVLQNLASDFLFQDYIQGHA
jgi:hypothetical protein